MTQPTLAFFDLDKTIVETNSANGWLQREYRLGFLGKRQVISAFWWLGLYHLGKSDVSSFIERAASWVKGQKETDFQQRIQQFWNEELQFQVRPKAQQRILTHQQKGHKIILLTSALHPLAHLVAKQLGIAHIQANDLIEEAGFFTGKLKQPLCFGIGKIERAKQILQHYDSDWQHCYFYTDSYSDLPLLERVGKPIVINPDPRLAKKAKMENWKIEDWHINQ